MTATPPSPRLVATRRQRARTTTSRVLANVNHDLYAGFVTLAAIVLLVANGDVVVDSLPLVTGHVARMPDRLLTTAFILNVALVLFGWRRYKDLRREVEERTAAEQLAHELASSDPLTGFHNRRSLQVDGEHLISTARMDGDEVVVLLLDLDNFKNVNDAHGHATGDALLALVARSIQAACPPDTLIARLGGDEFVCVLQLPAEVIKAVAEQTARRLVSDLSQPFVVDGHTAHIGASIGIAQMDDGFGRIDALVRRADLAMYAAKRSGRSRFAWFHTDMESEVRLRGAIEKGIRLGIPRGEFVPYFEPLVGLQSGVLCGFELLARWDRPTGGQVQPGTFVPVAEENGLIDALSFSVARAGLIAARGWDPKLTIAINISPVQLRDPWLAQKIVQMLSECGFPPERLEIELTETAVFENTALADTTIRSLKNQGIAVSLDDFGTGFSSLSHLRALPLDRIKIDRSFVSTMTESANNQAIVTAISRLADSLDVPVTAEGVETEATRDALNALGIERGQGWLFGRAQSIGATAQALAEDAGPLLPGRRAAAS